jgi:hypothetical protein
MSKHKAAESEAPKPEPSAVETMTLRELIFKRLDRIHGNSECKSQDNGDGTITLLIKLGEGEAWPVV